MGTIGLRAKGGVGKVVGDEGEGVGVDGGRLLKIFLRNGEKLV